MRCTGRQGLAEETLKVLLMDPEAAVSIGKLNAGAPLKTSENWEN